MRCLESSVRPPTSCVCSSRAGWRLPCSSSSGCSVTRWSASRRTCCGASTRFRVDHRRRRRRDAGPRARRHRWGARVGGGPAQVANARHGRGGGGAGGAADRPGGADRPRRGCGPGRRRRRPRTPERGRFPDDLGDRRRGGGTHRGGAVAEPGVAAGGVAVARGGHHHDLPEFAGFVRLALRPSSRVGGRRRRARGPRRPVAAPDVAGRPRRPRPRGAPPAPTEPGGRRRPRVDAVLRGGGER